MDKWQIIHRYTTLSREGKVDKLRCRLCDNFLITKIGDDDEPFFRCIEDHELFPGTAWWDRIEELTLGFEIDSTISV